MASANLADATIEYLFTEPELITARQLEPLKIMWFQTKYAKLFKARASMEAPVKPEEYQQYFLQLAFLDGQLATLQEIMNDHVEANSVLKAQQLAQQETDRQQQEDLAKRAAKQVDN